MWLLPSKGRPASLARFCDAFRATMGSTPGLIIIDQADAERHEAEYRAIELPFGWSWRITDGVSQGDKLREIWGDVVNCAWLGLIGDDCVPETAGWDRALVDELDGSNFASCNDGWQAPKRVANCWVMSGDLVRAVGYVFPPGLQHLFVDDVWEQLADRVRGIWICRMDVMVRHRHVLKGEAAADETHRGVYGSSSMDTSAGLWPTDAATYQAWLAGDASRAAAAIAALRPTVDLKVIEGEQAAQERRIARAKSRRVLFCWPVAASFEPLWVMSWTHTVILLERMGIAHDEQMIIGSSNLPKARNYLTAHFRAGDWDDLVWIDADMSWPANAIIRLLASDKPVVGIVGRRKTDEVSWCVLPMPQDTVINQDDMGMIEVRRLGTGLMKISREAFETIIAVRPDLKRPGDAVLMTEAERAAYYKFFAFGDDDMGEDYWFCDLYRSCGGQVWVDPSIEMGHIGPKEFVGKFEDALKPALAAFAAHDTSIAKSASGARRVQRGGGEAAA